MSLLDHFHLSFDMICWLIVIDTTSAKSLFWLSVLLLLFLSLFVLSAVAVFSLFNPNLATHRNINHPSLFPHLNMPFPRHQLRRIPAAVPGFESSTSRGGGGSILQIPGRGDDVGTQKTHKNTEYENQDRWKNKFSATGNWYSALACEILSNQYVEPNPLPDWNLWGRIIAESFLGYVKWSASFEKGLGIVAERCRELQSPKPFGSISSSHSCISAWNIPGSMLSYRPRVNKPKQFMSEISEQCRQRSCSTSSAFQMK